MGGTDLLFGSHKGRVEAARYKVVSLDIIVIIVIIITTTIIIIDTITLIIIIFDINQV